jgi:hypothetical protein
MHDSDIVNMAISGTKRETEYTQDTIDIFRVQLSSSDVYINPILLLGGNLYYATPLFPYLGQTYSTKSRLIIF